MPSIQFNVLSCSTISYKLQFTVTITTKYHHSDPNFCTVIYTVDLSNPLLSKYGFNHSEFSAGATFAIRDTVNAIQSPDFIEHCKG